MYKIFLFIALLSLQSCRPRTPDLKDYFLADSELQLSVIASEPQIIAPVAIDFDKKGRLWVAEMPDYMPDINGEKESIPAGRIIILEDNDGDGVMDHSKTFLDHIHQLRAITLFKDGILYADDPNLYYAEIKNDVPHNIQIIDSTYSSGGNVEHKPNGLLKNIDNCFYNAKSHYRYCYKNGEWSKEAVFFRGQWGITQDVNGRIYSNDNSNFLFGDALLPGMITHNQFIHKPKGINQDLVKDRTVFPLHATSINRGYAEGTLDEEGMLKETTSACGPYILQSSILGENYKNDAFICVPEANLIKQLEVKTNLLENKAEFSLTDQEFLASTDEAFRPVNISIGPDGSLYIVDFHRGIIQHKIYMTNYLKEEIESKKLDEVMKFGRILRVHRKEVEYRKVQFDFKNLDSLIHYLSSDNEWLRRVASEELIFSDEEQIDELLYQVLDGGNKQGRLQSLWALEARGNIDLNRIKKIEFQDPWVIANLFKLVAGLNLNAEKDVLSEIFQKYRNHESPVVINHLVAASHCIYKDFPALHQEIWLQHQEALTGALLSAYPSGEIIASTDERFQNYNEKVRSEEIYYIHKPKKFALNQEDGYFLYNKYCSSCHGYGGNGAEGQAPSLVGAKLINSDAAIVPLIIMHGLKNEVTVNGKKEKYGAIMPAFLESADLSSDDIIKISNYIYNAFREEVQYVDQRTVDSLFVKYKNRKEMWTEDELLGTE